MVNNKYIGQPIIANRISVRIAVSLAYCSQAENISIGRYRYHWQMPGHQNIFNIGFITEYWHYQNDYRVIALGHWYQEYAITEYGTLITFRNTIIYLGFIRLRYFFITFIVTFLLFSHFSLLFIIEYRIDNNITNDNTFTHW